MAPTDAKKQALCCTFPLFILVIVPDYLPPTMQNEDLWGAQLQHLTQSLGHLSGPDLAQLVYFLGTQHAQLTQGMSHSGSWQLSHQVIAVSACVNDVRARS